MKKVFSLVLILAGLLVANAANAEKFYFGLSSDKSQTLSFTLNDDYSFTVALPANGGAFNPSVFTSTMRGFGQTVVSQVESGVSQTSVDLTTWLTNAKAFTNCSIAISSVVEGQTKTVTYAVTGDGSTITGTPDNATVAAEIAGSYKAQLLRSEQLSADSYLKFAKGSYYQSGDEKLVYDQMKLFGQGWTVNGTLGKLAEGTVESSGTNGKDVLVLKDGTEFAFGYKVAQFENDLTITINTGADHTGKLTAFKAALTSGATPSDKIINGMKAIAGLADAAVGDVQGKTNLTGTSELENMQKYKREGLTIGKYYTIVYKYNPDTITGADFFAPADYSAATGLAIDPVELNAVGAGKPYFFQATATTLAWKYAPDATEETLVENNGLVGVYTPYEVASEAEEVYMLTNNMLRKALTGSTLSAYRAYVKIEKIEPQPAVSGRRYIAVEKKTPTELDAVVGGAAQNGKVIINGQFVIVKDGKLYSAQGQEL